MRLPYIRMQSRKLSLGLIVSFLFVVCQPQANAQFRSGELDLGPTEFSRGITRSGALTASRGGLTKTDSVAVNREVNIAGFEVDSTLKLPNQRQNGQDEASLNAQNFRRPLGLQLDANGAVDLKMDFDLINQHNKNNDVRTAAQANAHRVGPFMVTDRRAFGTIEGNAQSEALTRGFGIRRGRRAATQTAKNTAVSAKLFLNNNLASAENRTVNLETNKPQERTFSFMSNLFGRLLGGPTPNCVYPCTLEAFQSNACCPPEYLPIPVPLDTQNCHNCGIRGHHHHQPQFGYHQTHNPYFSQFSNSYFGNSFYQQGQQCCTVCLQYNYNGPLPCAWRNSQFGNNFF